MNKMDYDFTRFDCMLCSICFNLLGFVQWHDEYCIKFSEKYLNTLPGIIICNVYVYISNM